MKTQRDIIDAVNQDTVNRARVTVTVDAEEYERVTRERSALLSTLEALADDAFNMGDHSVEVIDAFLLIQKIRKAHP